MAPLSAQSIASTASSGTPSSNLDGAFSAVGLMLLAATILPGLVVALTAVCASLFNAYEEEDDDYDGGSDRSSLLSADRFDEFVVLHRPDLLFSDAVATHGSDLSDSRSQRTRTESLSDCGSLPNEHHVAATPLLVSDNAVGYGTMDHDLSETE